MTLKLDIDRSLGNTPRCGEIPESRELYKRAIQVAWPSVLEMLLISLVSIVDTAMVSSLGEAAIAAVGITNQPKFFGLCFFRAQATAVSALAARRKGQGHEAGATQVLRMVLLVTVLMSLLTSGLFLIFAEPICRLAGAGEDILSESAMYLQIVMGGIIFTTLSSAINAAQRGCGITKLAMKTNVTANLVNVVCNYLLIGGHFGFPALGIRGAAIATVIGTAVGYGMSIVSLFSSRTYIQGRNLLRIGWGKEDRKDNVRSLLDVGGSAFAEKLFVRTGFFLFSLIIAKLGTLELAAHFIGINLMSLSFCVADGLQIASISLSGQSLGKKRPDLARIYAVVCQRIGLLFALGISGVLVVFSDRIFHIFSDNPQVLAYGEKIVLLLCLVLLFQISQVIYGGTLRGAGDTKYTALVSLLSITIFRVSFSWVLCYGLNLGLIGAWIGIVLQQALSWALYHRRFLKGQWIYIKL